jgi:hypothetical protein
MIVISREELKTDPRLQDFFTLIKAKHEVASHTIDVLYKNRHVKDFCEEARHFVMIGGKKPLYFHYDVSSWYNSKKSATIRIESVAFYDNFMEYEKARLKGLHSTPNSSVNLN